MQIFNDLQIYNTDQKVHRIVMQRKSHKHRHLANIGRFSQKFHRKKIVQKDFHITKKMSNFADGIQTHSKTKIKKRKNR